MVLVEACVDSPGSAIAAARAGAHRLELCANLEDGGITPSLGAIESCLDATSIPVFVMVRPRAGHFCYDGHDLQVMRRDIVAIRRCGAHGVVVGVLTETNEVDAGRVGELVDLARPLPVTFHRAFDLAREPQAAFERLLQAGVDRLLTSGGAQTALEGAETIGALVRRAGARMVVMAGGGIRAANVGDIVAQTRVPEVHTGAWRYVDPPPAAANSPVRIGRLPGRVAGFRVTDEDEIARIVVAAQLF